jgi:hypothetical protein
MRQQIASKTNRDGLAERCADAAVPKRLEVALALLDHDDRLLREMALRIRQTAKPHEAKTLSLLRTGPGLGERRRVGLRSEMPEIARFPRGQERVASCRLGQCATASAGKRSGPAGTKLGTADRTWACAAAAALCLRHPPAGHKVLARVAKKQGQGQARTGLAPQRARAVSSM